MRLTTRDIQIITLISELGMATTGQLAALRFASNKSQTPLNRTISRLNKAKYISIVGSYNMSDSDFGSGQRVIQLGSVGWEFLKRRGKYAPYRAVRPHMIRIVSAYVELKLWERAGVLRELTHAFEPNTHITIGGAKLKPDLHLEFEVIEDKRVDSLWIEIDLGTENMSVIDDMLKRYSNAYERATVDDIETFPLVMFLVPDELRQRAIQSRIRRLDESYRQLFLVCVGDNYLTEVIGT